MADKTPDDNHQTLDPTMQHGVINWSTPNSGDATGRLMVTSRNTIMARNFSCGNYTVICSGYYANYNNFIGVGQALQLYQLYPTFCAAWGPGQCGGNQQSGGSASYYSYMNDSSIINFNDSSQQYAQRPMFLGMSPGSTTIIAQATENGCMTSGSGTPTVQQPDHIVVTNDATSMITCPVGVSRKRDINYNVDDSNGNTLVNGLRILETVDSSTTSSCDNSTVTTTASCLTLMSGSFTDRFAPGCPSTPKLANGCGYRFPNQDWQWCSPTSPVPIGNVGTDNVMNTSISIGGNTSQYSAGTTFTH